MLLQSSKVLCTKCCPDCAISKSSRHLPAGKILPLPIPNWPWSHLGVDFITDLPVSDGKTCILVIIDRFSKFCHLIPLAGLPTALQTAELLFNQVVRYYGIPEDIVSDRGPQFISQVWKAFFSLLGVTMSLSSGYHPQSNGQTECKIQDVGRFLRSFCHGRQNSWNQFLGWAEYAQNFLRQSLTGLTPFQCVLGFQPPLFPWSGEPSDVPAVDYWFTESEGVWDTTHHQLQQAVRRQRMAADVRRSASPEYQPGQKVWLSTRDIKLRLLSRKLSPRFVGSFAIVEQINPVTYKLQLLPHYKIQVDHHAAGVGPQERAVERGVLSRIGQAFHSVNHNDPIHQNSNHALLHLITTVITASIRAPATVHSPSDLVDTTWTLLLLQSKSWVSTLPYLPVDHYLMCLLLVFSSPARLSVSVVSVLQSISPSHLPIISVDKRRLTVTRLPIVRTIYDVIHSPQASIAHPVQQTY